MEICHAFSGVDQDATTIHGLEFTCSFHPKSVGFAANKVYLSFAIRYIEKVPRLDECIPAPGLVLNSNLSTIP